MNELQVTARCRIHDGMLEKFEAAAGDCLRSVREKDRGTRQYDWFFNSDRSECVVRETYADSEAVLQHIDNLGDTFGALLATCDLSIEVYGNPSEQLLSATTGLDTEVYSYFQGL